MLRSRPFSARLSLTRACAVLAVAAPLLLAAPLVAASETATSTVTARTAEPAPTRYRLRTVTELGAGLDAMRAAQSKVARSNGPTALVFRTAAVVLLAGDKARKAGNLEVAKILGTKTGALLDGSAKETLEKLMGDEKLKPFLGTADGEVPGGEGKVLTEAEWSKGLEKE